VIWVVSLTPRARLPLGSRQGEQPADVTALVAHKSQASSVIGLALVVLLREGSPACFHSPCGMLRQALLRMALVAFSKSGISYASESSSSQGFIASIWRLMFMTLLLLVV
jgi:hypothetical protein